MKWGCRKENHPRKGGIVVCIVVKKQLRDREESGGVLGVAMAVVLREGQRGCRKEAEPRTGERRRRTLEEYVLEWGE